MAGWLAGWVGGWMDGWMDGWIAPEPQGPLDPHSEAEAPPSASVAILPNTNCSRELCDQSLFDFNRSLILSLNDHVPLQTSAIRHATCRKFEVTQGKLSAHPHWLSPSKTRSSREKVESVTPPPPMPALPERSFLRHAEARRTQGLVHYGACGA